MIIALLLAAFVLWLAVNNRLGVYYNILIGRGPPAGASPAVPPASPPPAPTAPWSWTPDFTRLPGGTWLRDWYRSLNPGAGSVPAP
jgi:hypothetical protein